MPEAERSARPRDIFWIGIGGNLAFSVVLFGWLPLTFGLGWWSTVSSMVVGYAIGALLVTPMGCSARARARTTPSRAARTSACSAGSSAP